MQNQKQKAVDLSLVQLEWGNGTHVAHVFDRLIEEEGAEKIYVFSSDSVYAPHFLDIFLQTISAAVWTVSP